MVISEENEFDFVMKALDDLKDPEEEISDGFDACWNDGIEVAREILKNQKFGTGFDGGLTEQYISAIMSGLKVFEERWDD